MTNLDHSKRLAELSPEERLALFEQARRKKKAQDPSTSIPLARRTQEEGPFPLSFAQQRLWFLEQFEPDTSLYNMTEIWLMTGGLHYATLQNAMNALVAR